MFHAPSWIGCKDLPELENLYNRLNEITQKTVIGVLKHPDTQYIFCNNEGQPYGDIKKSWLTAVKKLCSLCFLV